MAAVKSFRISRASTASHADGPHDPFAKFVFEPALESDELFDALREAYPAVKTHTERKKQAILEFLMDERQAIEQQITAFVQGSAAPAPVDAFSPKDHASPPNPPSARNPSTSYSGDESLSSSTAPSSGESSPETLSLKQMTSVWTASGDAPPKIHHRRSMTTKEKEEYRKRRQMKACQDCRSRKRKCNHDTAASSRVTSKVKKRSKAPQHTTPSESSFQLEGSSVWGESSLMGSVMESPLNFTDFGPPPPAGVEGFEDFLLLPEDDEFSMAFSPDPLFSTAAMNNTFPYTYAEPQQPTHSFAVHQPYAQSFGSNSSTSASAYSSPGRYMAPANTGIAPAQMTQSSQNWDMGLAGHGVNMDLTSGNLHGQAPMPVVETIPSGSGGGGRGADTTLHNVVQPQPSRGRQQASADSTLSAALSQRPPAHSGTQPLITERNTAPVHTCEGVGTERFSASVANAPGSTRTSNGNSPLVFNNTSSSVPVTQSLVTVNSASSSAPVNQPLVTERDPARLHTCEGVGTAGSSAAAAEIPLSTHNSNSNSQMIIKNTSSSAPATGLVCYVPSPPTTRRARRSPAGVTSSSGSDASDSVSSSRTSSGGIDPGTATTVTRTSTVPVLGGDELASAVVCDPGRQASPLTTATSSTSSSSIQRDSINTANQLSTNEREIQRRSGSLRSALADTPASSILLSALFTSFFFPSSTTTAVATLTRFSPELILALTALVFFALSYARHVAALLSSLVGMAPVSFVDGALSDGEKQKTAAPRQHSFGRALGLVRSAAYSSQHSRPSPRGVMATPKPYCERVPRLLVGPLV
ncbi:hypothetical protein IWZ03DRAFT_371160 [Phyllosticta citriasiana]|uniref:Uncharacterized protein n=1 Tax=Phyllosticta citriasiana TaxID=595635 RepID=A0ABR1KW51_9PEZI